MSRYDFYGLNPKLCLGTNNCEPPCFEQFSQIGKQILALQTTTQDRHQSNYEF